MSILSKEFLKKHKKAFFFKFYKNFLMFFMALAK